MHTLSLSFTSNILPSTQVHRETYPKDAIMILLQRRSCIFFRQEQEPKAKRKKKKVKIYQYQLKIIKVLVGLALYQGTISPAQS